MGCSGRISLGRLSQ